MLYNLPGNVLVPYTLCLLENHKYCCAHVELNPITELETVQLHCIPV